MRHRVHQEIFFSCCLLLAFFLPVFPRILPAIISLMVLNWLLSGIYLVTIPVLFRERWRLLTLFFALLYLLYVIGMLYSTDFVYGRFDLEVKLSLFIFPVIFATSDPVIINYARLRLFFVTFISGCLVGSLIILGHAWMVNERYGIPDPFYYTNFSWYFHSSYLAMYYTFGVGILLYYLSLNLHGRPDCKNLSLVLIILYLQVLIFLLSSKAGLITLVITELLFVLLLIYKKANLWRIALISILLGIVFIGLSKIFPFAFTRLSKANSMISASHSVQTDPSDGTVARMEIWKVSIDLIKQNFLFGVGTGDVKDVFIETYKQKNLNLIFKKKLNAHNQYLQTFVTLGIVGFGLLFLSLIAPAYWSLRNGKYVYFLFIVIFAVNILFESMLETQAGVIFYAFFNAFLFSKSTGTDKQIKGNASLHSQ